jgi:GR25 family glycosyltransferase involved in LPS biosynthesis
MNLIRKIIYVIIIIFIIKKFFKKLEYFDGYINSVLDIDKIYIINLEKDKDRWDYISNQCKKINLNINRFDAIYGKNLPEDHPDIKKYIMDNNLRDKRLNYGIPLNPGQIGCALSHIKIWEEAYEKGYENILIFEDDAIIPDDFNEKINPILKSLPENWDYLSLNCAYCQGQDFNENLYKVLFNLCTVSYMLSKNGIKKLLDTINKFKIDEAIDDYLCSKFFLNSNSYLAKDHFIIMNTKDFESNIGVGTVGENHQIIIK